MLTFYLKYDRLSQSLLFCARCISAGFRFIFHYMSRMRKNSHNFDQIFVDISLNYVRF